MSTIEPKKLAIYYGWPSSLNPPTNGWNLDNVANDLAQYDLVVLGAGLEDSSHGDHQNTKDILAKEAVADVKFYGYIDTASGQSTNETKVDNWKLMGTNLVGIFCDKFGYDFGNTRQNQNQLVSYIHTESLKAFVNAWNVDDVFSGNPKHKLDSGDRYLAESYQIINGGYQTKTAWRTKSDKMISYHASEGTQMACITTYDTSAYDQGKMDYAFYSCVLDGHDAFGWGELNFSASSALMPYRTRPEIQGTKHTGAIQNDGDIYERPTNIGIHIDTAIHTAGVLLD